jgi:hypothetical protein
MWQGKEQKIVHMPYEPQSWRDLLSSIIDDPQEKQHILDELAISSITLTRWVSGETEPRVQNIRHLLAILPRYREPLLRLLNAEKWFSQAAAMMPEPTSRDIAPDFYAHILFARAGMTDCARNWFLCQLILQQALQQLDYELLGMAVWLVRCMPPSGPHKKVRSLRETLGFGTLPWSQNLEQKALFLGAESLAGNVVTLCRPGIIQNLDEEHSLIPSTQTDFEKSAAIYPILFAGRIAGVLMVSSTQPNFFLSSSITNLVQQYADLLALAFEPEEFFAPSQIVLGIMPPHEEQKRYFAPFRQLVADTMRGVNSQYGPLDPIEADLRVWQRLEEDLLNLSMTHSL